ncbi:putative cold-shock protein [uncultured Woeseiaceae bacterium]|uniref:Putative cold-shock protein n=1 Tax=uncultured Woeseiaceae bacterium TaxID=1983305 RepID=A0A7D9H5W0_9GAMM|nr:putative cold-shock protein [uncultured Woeseiaceae bacterium]
MLKNRMRSKGTISSWNDDKDFGFICPQAGGKTVFVHINEFSHRSYCPKVNDIVTYALSKDKQGRPCAVDAAIAGAKLKKKATRKSKASSILFAHVFLGAVAISAVTGHLPIVIVITYAALSLISFVAYAIDKSAARRGAWRTKEGTLHILGLTGGWPGALIAQQTLRHKTKKTSFRAVFWVTILANCVALAWLHTEGGRAAWETALHEIGPNPIFEYRKLDSWFRR